MEVDAATTIHERWLCSSKVGHSRVHARRGRSMEINMILYIALDEEVPQSEESVVGLSDGCDEGIIVSQFVVAAHCSVENEGI